MKIILKIIFLYLVLTGCSMNHALKKTFVGKETETLEKQFGKPATVIPRSADSIMVFERKNDLDGTEISQGRGTLDPILSPRVTKIERYLFTVKSGRITDARYERIYER